ncbi:LmbU family transcriptional regulator [Actinoplanes sp. NPDC049599]|uniref:LmbU family transcriptional regulator n=1 Tax=Actinoplanes sp. NPDC049599 TaxID=3363903 RepID=UPI00378AB9B5
MVLQLAGPVTLLKSGISFPRGLSQHVWEKIGMQLHEASNSSAWWLADWLIFGETAFSGRYREAISRTGLDYQTLRNYAWIARKFPHERRVESLSIAHHAEVAGLAGPEQDYWLRKAAEEHWSRNRLRREVRASLAEREAAEGGTQEPSAGSEQAAAIHVELAPEQFDSCVRIADSYGLSVNEWVAHVLRSATHDFAPDLRVVAQ